MHIALGSMRGMPKLFLDYVTDWRKVRGFYRHPYSSESMLAFARKRAAEKLPHRDVLCRALATQQRERGSDTAAVDKLAGGAVAVVTGQQPGLFTGPLFTILKAITAIKLARMITEAGVSAVPVFWIAAEDHDHEEIAGTHILDRDSGLRQLRADLSNRDSAPVGWLQF